MEKKLNKFIFFYTPLSIHSAIEVSAQIRRLVMRSSAMENESTYKMDPDSLFKGLEKAVQTAKLITGNCTTKLSDEFSILRDSANNLSNSVLRFHRMLSDIPAKCRKGFVLAFPGSSLDKDMRDALDQMRAAANRDPRIRELDAYRNSEKICGDLALDPPRFN